VLLQAPVQLNCVLRLCIQSNECKPDKADSTLCVLCCIKLYYVTWNSLLSLSMYYSVFKRAGGLNGQGNPVLTAEEAKSATQLVILPKSCIAVSIMHFLSVTAQMLKHSLLRMSRACAWQHTFQLLQPMKGAGEIAACSTASRQLLCRLNRQQHA